MPAVENQLADCIGHVLDLSKSLRVGVVSPQDYSTKQFSQRLGPASNIRSERSSEALKELKNLDVLVVNQALHKELNDDHALDKFIVAALRSLRIDGAFILRQDLSKINDPKKVAVLTDYFNVFRNEENGGNVGFSFYAVNEVEDSIHVKNSHYIRDFLDRTQYTDTAILAYEWIFGDNFISPGGREQNLFFLKRMGPLKTGQRMLDIGVGIGGGARQAASEFGLHVMGIDLSSNMLAIALDRIQREKDSRVCYAICDAVVYDFEPNSFDYVFSRDCIQHIKDTEVLFSRIFRVLKPAGKVLVTMYGAGRGDPSEQFKQYVAQRQYYLKNIEQIEEITRKVGFIDIEIENMTPRFKEILLEERQRVEQNKAEFIKKFSQKDYDSLVNGWNSKLQYIEDDNQNWNLIMAVKPYQSTTLIDV